MGRHHHIASNHYDGPHANNPYLVVYTPDEELGDFQFVEGAMHSEYASFVSASEALEDERWREHLHRADCEWLLPYLRRMAAGEDVSTAEILRGSEHHRARRWAERTGSLSHEEERDVAAEFALPPDDEVPKIRRALREELGRPEEAIEWPLVRLYCVLLFAHGDPVDAPLVWRAREAAPFGAGGIGIELLCGAGLERTVSALDRASSPEAEAALAALGRDAGDGTAGDATFDDWSPADELADWQEYYGVERDG